MNDHEKLVIALREVLRDDSPDTPLLVRRVPFICADIQGINKSMSDIKDTLDKRVVTQDQFWPVKTLVYGATGVMLLGVIAALVAIVVK